MDRRTQSEITLREAVVRWALKMLAISMIITFLLIALSQLLGIPVAVQLALVAHTIAQVAVIAVAVARYLFR